MGDTVCLAFNQLSEDTDTAKCDKITYTIIYNVSDSKGIILGMNIHLIAEDKEFRNFSKYCSKNSANISYIYFT